MRMPTDTINEPIGEAVVAIPGVMNLNLGVRYPDDAIMLAISAYLVAEVGILGGEQEQEQAHETTDGCDEDQQRDFGRPALQQAIVDAPDWLTHFFQAFFLDVPGNLVVLRRGTHEVGIDALTAQRGAGITASAYALMMAIRMLNRVISEQAE